VLFYNTVFTSNFCFTKALFAAKILIGICNRNSEYGATSEANASKWNEKTHCKSGRVNDPQNSSLLRPVKFKPIWKSVDENDKPLTKEKQQFSNQSRQH